MRIIVVDCKYVESEFAAAYLLIDRDRGFFIECNTNHAIPLLAEAARKAGLSPEQIEGLLITHVHLDHAGGAGLFLETFPNAVLYAHPRAARHAIDPSRLVQSATRVYGEDFMRRLYGTILPCPSGRVRELEDRSTIPFGPAGLEIRHVRGHANHHVIAREPVTGTVFTGDAFGVAYPASSHDRIIVIPSTSPTDFDGEAALNSVDLIESLDPERVALTHFGFIEKNRIKEAADRLRSGIRISMEIVEEIRSGRILPDQVESELTSRLSPILPVESREIFRIDLRVNAQGLVHASTQA
jgi:glyoxylase-like metal-dependent hydrolase (beta-lactamase superfamily II)